jgi:TrmH family RNA methyltransferase
VLTEKITSRQNPLIKRAQRVRDGEDPAHMFVEGVRLVEEALDAELPIEALIYTAELSSSERGAALLERAASMRFRGALVPEPLMRAVCDVETPQGVVALAPQPRFELDQVLAGDRPLAVALEALQDPGNVGTILRSAEAAGAAGVITSPGTAEPYGAKALRASMGSAFRIPVARRVPVVEIATAARSRGVRLVATDTSGGVPYSEYDWSGPAVLLVGNEGSGLSEGARAAADDVVSIPLAPSVESLNASIATAVILFEAARQRAAGRAAAPSTRKRQSGRKSPPRA